MPEHRHGLQSGKLAARRHLVAAHQTKRSADQSDSEAAREEVDRQVTTEADIGKLLY